MSRDSLYKPRLFIDGVEALQLVSVKYNTTTNNNVSTLSAKINAPDLQESSLYGKKVEFFLNNGSEDGSPLFVGYIRQVQPTERNISINAYDVRTFLTETSTTLTLTDDYNYDGHNLSQFLKSYVEDYIIINETYIDVNKLNSTNPPVSLTGLRGDFKPYDILTSNISKAIDITDIQEPLNYSIDVVEDSIVFLKKRKLDSTPSLVLSKSNGLIDFKYNQRPKKFNVNYMNRKLTYGSSPNGVFTIDYEGEGEFPAEQRHMAYMQLVNELQNNQEITVTASMGHYIGLENIVFLNVDDSNIAGAHRVVSKSITCNQSSISLTIGLNKGLPVLSDYLSQ